MKCVGVSNDANIYQIGDFLCDALKTGGSTENNNGKSVLISKNDVVESIEWLNQEVTKRDYVQFNLYDYDGTGKYSAMLPALNNFDSEIMDVGVEEEFQYSLEVVGKKLVKIDKDRKLLVANFSLIPIEIIALQKTYGSDYETARFRFRLNFEGGCGYIEVNSQDIEKLDVVISKKFPKLVVLNRTAFNDYVTELRAGYAKKMKIVRISTVEGFVLDASGKWLHTSTMPKVYRTVREYPQWGTFDCYTAVERGVSFLEVGSGKLAIHLIFLVAHLCYAFPFLTAAGMRPQFIVLIEAPSGTGKTGVCRELFNVFAPKKEQIMSIINSTSKGLQRNLRSFRHETAVVDDIAPAGQSNVDKTRISLEDLTRLLGDDNLTVKASTSDVDVVKGVVPEMVCVVTTETGMVKASVSTDARHFAISMNYGEIDIQMLSEFSRNPDVMKKYFYSFIAFLQMHQTEILNSICDKANSFRKQAEQLLPEGTHARIVGNVQCILALNSIVTLFYIHHSLNVDFINTTTSKVIEGLRNYFYDSEKSPEIDIALEFIELFRSTVSNGKVKLKTPKEMREVLLCEPKANLGHYAVVKDVKDQKLAFLEPKAWYEALKASLAEKGVIVNITVDEFKHILKLKGVTVCDENEITKKMSFKLSNKYNRVRWIAVPL